ncbi:para-nitrobenzyl esterase-like [Colias croceus]|uniref:para-nitrobenzyl esterase-like n=1 Tax=Colias crocea TaxID=72248 RepID=UPI001E27C6F4|nr:para-nitrobenzyl esterase-like [Colias croceus]
MTLSSSVRIIFYLSISLYYCYAKNSSNFRVVQTSQGPVRGYLDANGEVFEFFGIPYAKAPTNTEKFKAPLPPDTWDDIYEAINNKIICPQPDYHMNIPDNAFIVEDCLVANVFVPNTNIENAPVLVIVHGGAFIIGTGNGLSFKRLMKTADMVVVTFNYRLGPHGFLCLGTEDVPGNAGMKDQVALLRWVQKNIRYFGGNPEDVTLSGFSAGASAVDLLIVSNTTRGLFTKAILESGSNTAAFSIQSDPIEKAKEYAKLLNFTNVDDIQALEQFYKNASHDTLISADVMSRSDSTFLISPCVERDIGQETFLTDSPVNILRSGNFQKVPMLTGFANMEGLFRMFIFDFWKNQMNENFSDFLPADLQFQNKEQRQEVSERIKYFYFGNETVSEKTVLNYVDYFTDVIFAYSILRTAGLQVAAGNDKIYLYEYSFVDEDTPYVPYTNVRGADHCAQTTAVFDAFVKDELTPEYREMKRQIRKLWANFITTGMPVPNATEFPSWPAMGDDADGSPYMALNLPLQLKDSLLKERRLFWDDIYAKHYLEPKSPSARGNAKSNTMPFNIFLYICIASVMIKGSF